jgi:hypothetical protein
MTKIQRLVTIQAVCLATLMAVGIYHLTCAVRADDRPPHSGTIVLPAPDALAQLMATGTITPAAPDTRP